MRYDIMQKTREDMMKNWWKRVRDMEKEREEDRMRERMRQRERERKKEIERDRQRERTFDIRLKVEESPGTVYERIVGREKSIKEARS